MTTIALLIGGAPPGPQSPLERAIREGVSSAISGAHIVSGDELQRAVAQLAIVAADHLGEIPALLPEARQLREAGVPLVWLYPEGGEGALSRVATASFPLRTRHAAGGDPLAGARLTAAAVARVATIGWGIR